MTLHEQLVEAQNRAEVALKDERAIVEQMQDKNYKEKKKKELLFNEVLLKSSKFTESMRDILDVIDVERGVELAMAELGDTEFTDEDHCDLPDGSEIKTVGIKLQTSKSSDGYSFKYQVTNVVTAAGTPKSGDIRLVMINVFNESVRYFFLPKNVWDGKEKMWRQSEGYKGTITGTWTKVGGFLTTPTENLDDYEVDSFETLAKMKATCPTA
tara:strand:+ start:637 stop:1272 length:636 start_codon:yes stop_codon:yes gene_type:complete